MPAKTPNTPEENLGGGMEQNSISYTPNLVERMAWEVRNISERYSAD